MTDFDELFYSDFELSKVPKKYLDNQELYNLFKKPPKEKKNDMPRYYNFEENNTHQADLLYLPEDKGFKYCLVVVDVATGKTDAEPLKNRSASDVLAAIKRIYNNYRRKILKTPELLIVDSGSEFQGPFLEYFKYNKVRVKKALRGRHRQLALVERKNQIIGKVLFMRMFAQELLTGEVSKQWVDDLPKIIKKINEKYSHDVYTDDELFEKFNPWQDLKQDIIPLGTNVRIALDEPQDIGDKVLHGKFRDTDHRYTTDIYKVVDYIFDPHQPILYKVNKPLKKNERVAYTRKQLQIVSPDEQDPHIKVIRGTPKQYAVKKLLGKRMFKKRLQYLVWWRGYKKDASTWEDSKNISKELIEKYENENV
jgi:hypothetical protein